MSQNGQDVSINPLFTLILQIFAQSVGKRTKESSVIKNVIYGYIPKRR